MLHINGMPKNVITEPDTMLAGVLRVQLNLTGTIDYGADLGLKMPPGTPNFDYEKKRTKGGDTQPLTVDTQERN